MPGPIDLDPDNVKPMSGLAYQDSAGNWRAGEDAVANGQADQVGQYVSEDYANRARSVRQNANAVKQNMRKRNLSEPGARERVNEALQDLQEELEKEEPDPDRIVDIQKRIGGSP